MTKTLACLLIACVALAAGTATAPAQDRTAQPGQPTQGKVWIQNRGDFEAVPVTIRSMSSDSAPLHVQVTGTPTVTIGNATVRVSIVRQRWEYRGVAVSSGQDLTGVLNTAGAAGWEATGVTMPAPGGILVVMKRLFD